MSNKKIKEENNQSLDPRVELEDKIIEKKLRPQKLNEFIGQEKLKEQLNIFWQQQSRGVKLWIIFYSMVHLGLGKQLWRV